MNAPFQRGQLVVCNIDHYTVKAGDKVRVVKCEPGECQTGWLVTATRSIRGRMPANPSIAVSGVDSSLFTPANTRLHSGEATCKDWEHKVQRLNRREDCLICGVALVAKRKDGNK